MKNFNELSGPWTGLSVQDGIRISEAIQLHISSGQIAGNGTDKDGDFELVGTYHERTQRVQITRRYTWTTEPSQAGVGVPYDYDGTWDGAMVSGRWCHRTYRPMNGPFEMWPNRDEDRQELMIQLEQLDLAGTP
jgi:hypothetical protein